MTNGEKGHIIWVTAKEESAGREPCFGQGRAKGAGGASADEDCPNFEEYKPFLAKP